MASDESTTPVEYRELEKYPGYRAGDDGSIWSCWERFRAGGRSGFKARLGGQWRKLRPTTGRSKKGYFFVFLRGNGRKDFVAVHKLILWAFVGPRPPGLECRHMDGNKGNNALTNLRWGTHTENVQDTVRHGTHSHKSINQGERHGNSRLRSEDVREMRRLRAEKVPVKDIAVRFGVHKSCVYKILRGTAWGHL